MNSIALLKVAEILEALPNNKNFNMDVWHEDDNNSCGTVACAIGHAAMHPWFIKRGLKLDYWYVPVCNSFSGFAAVKNFFKLNEAQACHLFESDRYPVSRRKNRKYVANRIRSFVKKNIISETPL